MRKSLLFSALCALVAAPLAHADKAAKAVNLPVLEGKKNDLTIQFVRYTGGTNGEMIVKIANRGKKIEQFDATGIYFVPEGDPEKAPQRLGAAGPFKVKKGNKLEAAESLALKPGESRELHLQVFCIDSHRSSPSASHRFGIAAKRMPKKLRETIKAGAADAIKAEKGSVSKAKGRIQSHVWKSRDSKWIKLQGERKLEKAPSKGRRYNRRDIRQEQRQMRDALH